MFYLLFVWNLRSASTFAGIETQSEIDLSLGTCNCAILEICN